MGASALPTGEMAGQSTSTEGHRPLFVEPGLVARTWWLLRRAFVAAYEDNCFGIAKGAAYSFLFSLFPVLTTLIAILLEFRAQSIVHMIASFVQEIAPPGTEDLILWRLRQHGRPFSLSVAAIVLALWAGSGAMMSLMEGFQAAYRIPSGRPFLKQRAMAIFLVVTAAFPAVAASALLIFGDRGERYIVQWLGISAERELSAPLDFAWRFARYVFALGTITFVMGLLYYFGPNHRPEMKQYDRITKGRFRRVWPGAFLATILWLLATTAFAWYVQHFAHYNIFYGSIWAVIVLLIWLYLIACIALIGCEFNAERERLDVLPIRRDIA